MSAGEEKSEAAMEKAGDEAPMKAGEDEVKPEKDLKKEPAKSG